MKYDTLHESVVKDITDVLSDVNGAIKDNIETNPSISRASSLTKATSGLTLVFPVLCSKTLPLDTATMISKAVEKKAVSLLQIAFSELQLGNGLRYTVNFHGQFVMDTNPRILVQFNKLIQETSGILSSGTYIDSYDTKRGAVDGRWALAPWVVRSSKSNTEQWLGPNSMKYDYKLKWRLK